MATVKQNLSALANIQEGMVTDDKISTVPFLAAIYGQEAKIGHITRKYPMSAGHINADASAHTTPIPTRQGSAWRRSCCSAYMTRH